MTKDRREALEQLIERWRETAKEERHFGRAEMFIGMNQCADELSALLAAPPHEDFMEVIGEMEDYAHGNYAVCERIRHWATRLRAGVGDTWNLL